MLEKLNITPTEAVRLLFQYVAENGRMPVKTVTVSDSEEELLRTVRERLANPQQGIKVSLDDL
ncbi:Antitoxin RelB [compost metagenome]